jgi:hypothetical protein
MASIWEKVISILAGNLISGHSSLITAVMKDYIVPWHVQYEDNHWPLEGSEQQPCPFQHQGGQQIFPHL